MRAFVDGLASVGLLAFLLLQGQQAQSYVIRNAPSLIAQVSEEGSEEDGD